MKSGKLAAVLAVLLALAACSRDPKVQAHKLVEQGNKFLDNDKLRQASIMYQNAIKKDKLSAEAYYKLGLTDLKLNAIGDAAKMFRYTIDLQPTNADALSKLADIYVYAILHDPQHSKDAVKEITELTNKLLARDQRSFDAHRILGQLAFLNGDYDGAIKHFELANEVNPLQSDVVQTYFLTLANSNRFPEAEKLARDFLNKDKTFSVVYDLLYLSYVKQKRMDDGEQVYLLKNQNNPHNASYMLQLASHYYLAQKPEQMDAVLKKTTDEKEYPGGRLMVGDFFLRLRDLPRAQHEYEEAIVALPKEKLTFQKRLVELYANTGNASGANDMVATILKEDPKDSDAIEMRAALMLVTGNKDQINQAASDLQTLVTKTPNNAVLRYDYARAQLAKGDVGQALLQLEESVKLSPTYLPAREMLARLYLGNRDNGKALKAAEEILAREPSNLTGHLVHSSALMALGDKDKAAHELDLITKNYPENLEARYQVGSLALQEKDYKKAEKVFGDLYKAYPMDRRGLFGLVDTLAAEDRMPEALKTIEAAVQANPTRNDMKLALGNIEVRAKKLDAAIQTYSDLLKVAPNSADLLYRLAKTFQLKGDLNQAKDNFRRCSQNSPKDTDCLVQLGMLMEGTGQRDQAQPVYEQILKLQPDNSVALNNLAFMMAEAGVDLDRALTMAQQARQKAPNEPKIADTLGWIYLKKKLNDDAVRVFRDLVQQVPANPSYHYHFGMALMSTGDKPSAKKEFEAAMRNKPNKEEDTKIRQLLQSLQGTPSA